MTWIASVSLSLLALATAATLALATRRERVAEAAHPPSGHVVEVDGRRVHYVEKGSGPAVVLIHGASGNLRDFTFDLADRLSARYRVIAFDRPGFGWSDPLAPVRRWSDAGATPAAQAAHLAAAARALGADRPIVLGHSYGGAVALAWALDHAPAAVVSLAGVANPWPGGLGWLYRIGGSAAGGALLVPAITAWAPDGVIRAAFEGTFRPQPMPEGYAEFMGLRMPVRRDVYRENARQVNSLRPHVEEMSQRYDALSLPIELVHGDRDETVPLAIHSAPLAARLPNAHLTVLPGVGHMPHHADPDAVVAAVDRAAARAGLR